MRDELGSYYRSFELMLFLVAIALACVWAIKKAADARAVPQTVAAE
jgi:hypothetical protein